MLTPILGSLVQDRCTLRNHDIFNIYFIQYFYIEFISCALFTRTSMIKPCKWQIPFEAFKSYFN